MKTIPLILTEHDLLAVRPATTHPEDHHLWVVLRDLKNPGDGNNFVTHVFNVTLDKGKGGFVSGRYFGADKDAAFLDFCTRQVPQTLWAVVRRLGDQPGDYQVSLRRSQAAAEHTAERLAQTASMSETDFSDRSWNADGDSEVIIQEVRL